MEKLKKYIFDSAPYRAFRLVTKRIKLPGFEGMSLYGVLVFLIDSFQKGDYSTRAAAISFRFFIALFPILLVFLSLIPRIPIPHFQEELLIQIEELIPHEAFHFIEFTIKDLLLRKHDVMLSVGFVLAFYFASEGMNGLLSAFDRSYQITHHRNPFKQRLVSFWLLVVFMLLITVAVGILIYSNRVIHPMISHNHYLLVNLFHFIKWVVVLFCFVFGISFLYNMGYPERKKWKIISAGATLSTAIIILTSAVLKFYMSNFASYNEFYGSIGSIIMIMIWLNITSLILLIGFELYANIEKRRNFVQEQETKL
ncbi:MAG: YihY/virulence factor BrkB family protein [Flavobacteriales bacterium]